MGGVVVPPMARNRAAPDTASASRWGAALPRKVRLRRFPKQAPTHGKRPPNRQRAAPESPTRPIRDRCSLPKTGAHGLPYSLRPGHGLRLPPAGGGSSGGIEPPKLPRADRADNPESSTYINTAAPPRNRKTARKATGRQRKEYIKAESMEQGPGMALHIAFASPSA